MRVLPGHRGPIRAVAYAPAGPSLLASGGKRRRREVLDSIPAEVKRKVLDAIRRAQARGEVKAALAGPIPPPASEPRSVG
jgi:hypothetical protein